MDTSSRDRQIQELVSRIVEAVHPLRVVLFGSAARGDTHADSDVDLLIVMPDGAHRRHTAQYLYRTIDGIRIPYDLAVATLSDLERYGASPGLVLRSAIEEGRTLYAG